MRHEYLDPRNKFKIFAHRGLVYDSEKTVRDENTILAFEVALSAGADYLELDVQCSRDGVAVVFHDETLDRVSTERGRISDKSWSELQQVKLNHGGSIPSIEQILTAFAETKINIDVKAAQAIPDLSRAIQAHNAQSRVLLTSFSEKRRTKAVAAITGAATSPSASMLLRIWFSYRIGIGLRYLLKKVNALQIPVSYGVLRLDSPKFITSVQRHDVEVIYWTINDPKEALRLQSIGANGIVTDRTDLMVELKKP
ncbi:MAG: hypothetical protein RLZZ471_195 [Actinomycetota bacterium]